MEDSEKVVKLLWKPPYHPDAQHSIQAEIASFRSRVGDTPSMESEFWYIDTDTLIEAARPFVEQLNQNPQQRELGWDPDDLDSALYLPGQQVGPIGGSWFTFFGVVEDREVIFVSYDALKAGGYLLHDRDAFQVVTPCLAPEPTGV